MPIRQLPASVVSKIAAGEVVERPSSAVKEMLENSLDAGAKSITVELGEGGREFIRVVDDGNGIPAEELPLAVSSHATSKLVSADDLFRVQTLGFRGEAVASIAGVSDFKMISRPKDQPTGAMIEVHHGDVQPVREFGCPPGTQVEVRNLFASVPVRRKFLKSKQTELGHVSEAVTRIALAFPDVALKLVHNDRAVLERPAGLDRRSTIGTLFGPKVAEALLPVEMERDGLRIAGYAASPEIDRPNSRSQYLFVNGRFIRDRSLGHAITEAYRGLVMTGRYPMVFLFLQVPPDQVDVNVHPTKIEVRFEDPHRIYSLLLASLRTRFLASDLTAKLQPPKPTAAAKQADELDRERRNAINAEFSLTSGPEETQPDLFDPRAAQAGEPLRRQGAYMPSPPPVFDAPAPPTPQTFTHDRLRPEPRPLHATKIASPSNGHSEPEYHDAPAAQASPHPILPVVPEDTGDGLPAFEAAPTQRPATMLTPAPALSGREDASCDRVRALQIHNSYLVVEVEDGMLLVDQHALHERILYEKFRQQVGEQAVEVQQLLVPEPVELTALQVGLLLEHRDVLRELGLLVEEFGNQCVLLQGFPSLLRRIKPEPLLRDIADHLEEAGKPPSRDQLLEELLNMAACKAAVKAGDPLTDEEVQELLRSRRLVEDSHHCPHGRPTVLRFTFRDLEKQFKRV